MTNVCAAIALSCKGRFFPGAKLGPQIPDQVLWIHGFVASRRSGIDGVNRILGIQ